MIAANAKKIIRLGSTKNAGNYFKRSTRFNSRKAPQVDDTQPLNISNKIYERDSWTNLTPNILDKMGRALHNKKHHPLNLIRSRIQDFFYTSFVGRTGNPIFAVFDNLPPVVTLEQNFDSLLVKTDHPSRHPKDSYYLNKDYMLRAHMTCHDVDILRAGLDRFLTVGDVYRRDTVDRTHYPVFHQMDGVRLFNSAELFQRADNDLELFEDGTRTPHKQELHTTDTVELLSLDLKKTLVKMSEQLFGESVEYRWVEAYFPFTHPSWELEIFYRNEWLEVLGCGILEQKILSQCNIKQKAGWAFGLGLERLAMRLYQIPDVRLFWSEDQGFLNQFKVDDCHTAITYKEISKFPPLYQDISFWIPDSTYSHNDFYDVVRTLTGDLVEHVQLIDSFTHPKKQRTSHAYRITYRHMHRTLTNAEVNLVQDKLRNEVRVRLGCEVRA